MLVTLLIVAGLFVLGLLLGALWLWVACLAVGVRHPAVGGDRGRRVGFGRAAAVTLLVTLLQGLILAGASVLGTPERYLSVLVLQLLVQLVVLKLTLPAALLRVLGVGLIWNVLSTVSAVALVGAVYLFVAEGFVVPTGGMAETVRGYHKRVVCPSCGHEFVVNAADEADPEGGRASFVSDCTCPNCRLHVRIVQDDRAGGPLPADSIANPGLSGGDRILVGKGLLGARTMRPERLDLLVFLHPGDPEAEAMGLPPRSGPAPKYVQRLIGKPGETVAIHRGKVFVLSPEKAKEQGLSHDDRQDESSWRPEFMHRGDERARRLFDEGQFEIVRKPPELVVSLAHLVHDNDRQPKDRPAKRWRPVDGSGWAEEGSTGFQHDGKEWGWLRYRHVLREHDGKPSLITDFVGYNSTRPQAEDWASDLIVECEVEVKQVAGEFALELSRGEDRFRATFDVASGDCTLSRISGTEGEGKSVELKKAATTLKGTGRHRLRFANVDDRLLVWVDGKLPFADGVSYDVRSPLVPTKENDLERPVSVGAGAEVVVSRLRVLRDVYHTTAQAGPNGGDVRDFDPQSPSTWKDAPVATFFVQPGHYFFLGDNSRASSDSRLWGVVSADRLEGKVLLRYFPFGRAGRVE